MDRFLKRKGNEVLVESLKKPRKVVRKYDPEYIKYGFISAGPDLELKAQCVECAQILSNEALKPSKLKRHLDSKHPEVAEKPKEYFKRKGEDLQKQQGILTSFTARTKSALKASYLVASRIARSKKAFTIGEELILPSAIDMCREIIGEAAASKLQRVSLSNDTVTRRIVEMSDDIECQMLEKIKASYYSIQLDESTDISNSALLLAFVRYCADGNIHDDLLFCKELPTRTTASEVMRCLDSHFTNKSIDWKKCVGVCTDGAASMTGVHHGVVKQILDKAENAKWTHCFLHRQNLASRQMSPELHEVLSIAVKTVNYFKKNALHSRCFAALCDKLDSDHLQLLYHCEVRWLSKGRVFNRLFELRQEVNIFLNDQRSPLADHYVDDCFCAKLAYLSDVFDQLNQLNLSMQGRNSSLFLVADKIEGFKKKLDLWKRMVSNKRYEMFPLLSEKLEGSPHADISKIIVQHLSHLSNKFNSYFPEDPRPGNLWILNPFSVNYATEDVELPSQLQNDLIELSEDSGLKQKYREVDLPCFWIQASREYASLSERAIMFLLPFTTTYLCESGFSTVTTTKSKARNSLKTDTLNATLRVSLSPIQPRIDRIISNKQAQVSH